MQCPQVSYFHFNFFLKKTGLLMRKAKVKKQWIFNFKLILLCKQCIQIRKHFGVATTNAKIQQNLAGPLFFWGGASMPYTYRSPSVLRWGHGPKSEMPLTQICSAEVSGFMIA